MPEIIIPGRAVKYSCMCGKKFADRERGIRHSVECAKRHTEEIREEVRAKRAFWNLDPEAREWINQRRTEGLPATKRGRPA